MATIDGVFEVEREGQTLVVTPLADLRELNFREVESGAGDVLRLLANGTVKNVVLDFRRTDYYGSSALGFFVKLWKRVRERGGRMAFCDVSAHEREILRVTNLDGLWPIFPSRAEALAAVGDRREEEPCGQPLGTPDARLRRRPALAGELARELPPPIHSGHPNIPEKETQP